MERTLAKLESLTQELRAEAKLKDDIYNQARLVIDRLERHILDLRHQLEIIDSADLRW